MSVGHRWSFVRVNFSMFSDRRPSVTFFVLIYAFSLEAKTFWADVASQEK